MLRSASVKHELFEFIFGSRIQNHPLKNTSDDGYLGDALKMCWRASSVTQYVFRPATLRLLTRANAFFHFFLRLLKKWRPKNKKLTTGDFVLRAGHNASQNNHYNYLQIHIYHDQIN